MSEQDPDVTEEMNRWHPLPRMIGRAIVTPEYEFRGCGGYYVYRFEDGSVGIYRVVDTAMDRDGLETEGDHVAELDGQVVAGEEAGYISPPNSSWESEVTDVRASTWEGFD